MVTESIIAEFRGPAGLDIDGIHLFKSTEAVDLYGNISKDTVINEDLAIFCALQNPPGIQLYVSVKVVVLNDVQLNKHRCW